MSVFDHTWLRRLPWTSGRTPRRQVYVFAATALAVFAVALTLFRDTSAIYLATATLAPLNSPGAGGSRDVGALSAALTSTDILAAAIDEVEAAAPRDASEGDGAVMTPDEIRRYLTIRRDRSTEGDRVRVSLTGTGRRDAIELVNALCRRAIAPAAEETAAHHYRASDRERARMAAVAAEENLRAARRQRDAFLSTHEEQLSSRGENPTTAAPRGPTSAHRTPDDKAAQARFETLVRDYEALQAQRHALLGEMTAEHPRYKILMDQIAQLEALLEEARGTLTSSRLPAVAEPDDRQKRQQLVNELLRLNRAVSDAEDRYEQLAAVAAEARAVDEARRPKPVWRLEKAVDARRLPRRTSASLVVFSAAIAVLGASGAMVALGAYGTIDSAGEAATRLAVPVLGTLSAHGEPLHGRRRQRMLPRAVVLGAEITLAVFLLAMMMVAILDHDFAQQLTSDPLSALADGLRRLPSVLTGRTG